MPLSKQGGSYGMSQRAGSLGTSTISVVDNFRLYADGTFLGTGRFRQVVTATESGK